MDFFCETCNYIGKTKQSYNRHLKTQKHLLRASKDGYKCICGQKYMSHQSLYLHRKTCELYNENIGNGFYDLVTQNRLICEENQTLKKDIMELRKQITLLLEKGLVNNNNSHNNTTNNIETQNVIVVNSFGQENSEYLTDQIVSKLIQNGPFTCLPKMIERIHFDPDHPENHNVKFTNHKNKYAKIIKNNKWVTANKKQTIDTMIQNSYGLLEDKYNDNKDGISEFKQERFEDFQEKYNNQEKELMKNIKDQVDIAVINGSDQIHK